MRKLAPIFATVVQVGLVLGFVVSLRAGWIPRGVPGEWEWPRIDLMPEVFDLLLAAAGVALFAGGAAMGQWRLSRGGRETLWVAALVPASVLVQLAALGGAPFGYGLTKWSLALHSPGSSGYFTVARRQIADLPGFLAAYPAWIATQDALHIGTHPPGLFVTAHAARRLMEAQPGLARAIVDHLPRSVADGFREIARFDPLSISDRAALAATGALTLLACALTVLPLYALARTHFGPPEAWAAACLWPLVPSAILFGPAADTAFPLLSTTALALAAHATGSGRWSRSLGLPIVAGMVLAVGMTFTLAFLPVGLVVGLVLLADRAAPWRRRIAAFLATGVGFLGATLAWWLATSANPLVVWWWNQANHQRFYEEYTRSYLAWVLANPLETAVAIGLPASFWALVSLARPRSLPRSSVATLLVLVVLNFSGRNLSEVARLWMLFFPPLLLLAAQGLSRITLSAGVPAPGQLATAIALTGAQTLALEATVQVVYPF